MRTFNALIIFSLLTFESLGQSNLAFNQVISNTIVISGNATTGSTGLFTVNAPTNYTVPNNKTWKIESINSLTETQWTNATNGGTPVKLKIKINNVLIITADSPFLSNASDIISNNAIWLKAGDVLSFSISNSSGYSTSIYSGSSNVHISIIEYAIIP